MRQHRAFPRLLESAEKQRQLQGSVEWEAEITPDNGASNVSFTIQDTGGDPKKPELTGNRPDQRLQHGEHPGPRAFRRRRMGHLVADYRVVLHDLGGQEAAGSGTQCAQPFQPSTVISYRLATPGAVRLEIYNLLGQSMRTLVDQVQAAGAYWVRWDARDGRGAAVAAGVYLVRLHYPGGVQTQRLLYLK